MLRAYYIILRMLLKARIIEGKLFSFLPQRAVLLYLFLQLIRFF